MNTVSPTHQNETGHSDFGLLFWGHFLLLVVSLLSPLYLEWRLILIVILLTQVSYLAFGGCMLTHMQLGKDDDKTFIWYYLQKVFPTLDARRTKWTVRALLPLLVLAIALVVQVWFGLDALIDATFLFSVFGII